MKLRGLKSERADNTKAYDIEKAMAFREQCRLDTGDKLKKNNIRRYNENGKVNTKAFKKTAESKGFWASFFDGLLAIFEEITGFGPGLKGEKSGGTTKLGKLDNTQTQQSRGKAA